MREASMNLGSPTVHTTRFAVACQTAKPIQLGDEIIADLYVGTRSADGHDLTVV